MYVAHRRRGSPPFSPVPSAAAHTAVVTRTATACTADHSGQPSWAMHRIRRCAGTTEGAAPGSRVVHHARLLVGGASSVRATRQAEKWLLAAAIRVVAVLVAEVNHAGLLVGGTSGAWATRPAEI